MLDIGFDDQAFNCQLLLHHAFFKGGNVALAYGLGTAAADHAGDLDHGGGVKVADRTLILHNAEHDLMGVIGNCRSQVNDESCMHIDLEPTVDSRARCDNVTCGTEDALLTTVHNLVGTGIVGVRVLHNVVREEVVFQVGVG